MNVNVMNEVCSMQQKLLVISISTCHLSRSNSFWCVFSSFTPHWAASCQLLLLHFVFTRVLIKISSSAHICAQRKWIVFIFIAADSLVRNAECVFDIFLPLREVLDNKDDGLEWNEDWNHTMSYTSWCLVCMSLVDVALTRRLVSCVRFAFEVTEMRESSDTTRRVVVEKDDPQDNALDWCISFPSEHSTTSRLLDGKFMHSSDKTCRGEWVIMWGYQNNSRLEGIIHYMWTLDRAWIFLLTIDFNPAQIMWQISPCEQTWSRTGRILCFSFKT